MPAGGEPVYFIDHDGRVFLVEDGDTLRLPRRDEVPFPIFEKRRVLVRGSPVVFGGPTNPTSHTDWRWKDDLPAIPGVDSLVRSASLHTMPRVVAKGAFTRGREVLLVRAKVGYYKGQWSLPGGYLDYGENPEECLLRELDEELGVTGEIQRLLHVDARVVESGIHFISFLYEGTLLSDDFRLKADEIEAAQWFDLERAMREVAGALSHAGLQALVREDSRA